MGTSIKICDSPFVKTRVIRFTNRFTLKNDLPFPLAIRTVDSNQITIVNSKEEKSLNIALKNYLEICCINLAFDSIQIFKEGG